MIIVNILRCNSGSMQNAEMDEPTVIRKTNNESSKECNEVLDNSDGKISEMPKKFKNCDKLTDEQINRYVKLVCILMILLNGG